MISLIVQGFRDLYDIVLAAIMEIVVISLIYAVAI